MSRWADRELRLELFKRLQRGVIARPELERMIDQIAGLKGHSADEVIRALDDLTTQGLARYAGNVYHILPKGSDMTPHGYLYSLIKDDHEKTKGAIGRYARLRLILSASILGSFLAVVVFLLAQSLGPLVPGYYAGIAFLVGLALLLLGSWVEGRDKSSIEKRLGTRLLDAYLMMANDDRGDVEKILKEVSRRLQRQWPRISWETLNCDRSRLAELGSNLERIVIPEVPNRRRSKDDLAEVVNRVACLLFDASPESIQRAVSKPQPEPSVYGTLPIPEEEKTRKVTPSIRDQVRNWRRIRPVRFLAVVAVLSFGVLVVASLYPSFSGVPPQLSTADFVMIFLGVPAAAAILDRYLVAPSVGS